MTADLWAELRRTTAARIGLGRSGNGLPTVAELELRAAHADARDAVHDQLDVAALTVELSDLGLGEPLHVASRAADRGEYLRRPDLGREPGSAIPVDRPAELVIVLADGLSARAAAAHGARFVEALVEGVLPVIAPPVIATQARVALGDHIGAAFGARAVLMLIGERPGLSSTDSLGAYLTWNPRPGRTDAERNCVSNIRPPGGLGYREAARVVRSLLVEAERLGESGVRVKDRSRAAIDDPPERTQI